MGSDLLRNGVKSTRQRFATGSIRPVNPPYYGAPSGNGRPCKQARHRRKPCAAISWACRRELLCRCSRPSPPSRAGCSSGGTCRDPDFQRQAVPLAVGLKALLVHLHDPAPPALFVESALLSECLPTFALDNNLDLLDRSVVPRIWIGNAIQVHTHCDFSNNIACVLAGRRRFTLFPPEQLPNLYPAPMDITLAGVPVSTVPLQNPDFERYPRFRRALAAAQTIELEEAGDALFIPYGWWHHVESLQPFNVLVNYW